MQVINQTQIDSIRSIISKQLSEKFGLDQVVISRVDDDQLYQGHEFESDVYAFEFIINGQNRYTTFFGYRNGKIGFTRCKEGIQRRLAGLIRPHDFGLGATDDYFRRDDVVGKFLEYVINQKVEMDIQDKLDNLYKNATKCSDYTFGYYVTRRHKTTMSYDADIEILVRGESDPVYKRYDANVINGRMVSIRNSDGVEVPLKSLF